MTSQFAILGWTEVVSQSRVSPSRIRGELRAEQGDEGHQGRGRTNLGVCLVLPAYPAESVRGWHAVLRLDLSRGTALHLALSLSRALKAMGRQWRSGGVRSRFRAQSPISPNVGFSRHQLRRYASHPNHWTYSIRWNHPRCPNLWYAPEFGGHRGGVSMGHVPNIGMTRTIGQILAVQLLGHRRTCHTSTTGPMVRLSPVDGMI
jgi:hypothetical protein